VRLSELPKFRAGPYRIAIRWPLGRLPFFPDDGPELTRVYRDLTGVLLAQNADDRRFWFTHTASRNRHAVPSFDVFHEVVACLNRAARNAGVWQRESLKSPEAEAVLAHLAKAVGAQVRRSDRLRSVLQRSIQAFKRAALFAHKFVDICLAVWHANRLAGSDVDKASIFIFTLIYSDHRQPDPTPGYHRDVYFGDLAQSVAATGQQTMYLGVCAQGELPTIRHFAENLSLLRRCRPILMYARVGDVVSGAMKALLYRPRLAALHYRGLDFAPLFAYDLKREAITVLSNEVTYRATRRFLSDHRAKRILCIYENNSWERAVYRAAHGLGVAVDGFLHCAILPGSLKLYCTAGEWQMRPRPDRIITTGPAARDLLLTIGEYPRDAVRAGVALRDAPPDNQPPTPASKPNRILVMLEGLYSMAPFLGLCHEAARRRPDLTFVVRAHSDLPAAMIAPLAGFSMDKSPLQVSEIRDLRSDIGSADVVLYQGTTAAITAGLMPRPLIRAAIDDRVDDDPLSGIDDMKWQVRSVDELIEALDQAARVGATEREAAAHRRAALILRRWTPPGSSAAEVFLKA
jgi:hypothetical protein